MASDANPRRRGRRAVRWFLAAIVLACALVGGGYVYLRYGRDNFHAVVPGAVYRSAQPSGDVLRGWIERYGLRTVVNLRGAGFAPPSLYAEEVAAARSAGATHVDIRLSAHRLPSRRAILRLIEVLEAPERRPLLLHCAAGADRTGMASVLAAMAIGGQDYATARRQLSWVYLRLDNHPEHIAGFLQRYEAWCRRQGGGTGGWEQFRHWATDVYRTAYYYAEITAPPELRARPGERLEVPLTIRNATREVLPAGRADTTFTVAAFLGSSEDERPDRELGRTPLPAENVPPGRAISVTAVLRAPRRPGTYEVGFDVVEEGRTWFARQGSPVGRCTLTVERPAAPSSGATGAEKYGRPAPGAVARTCQSDLRPAAGLTR